MKDHTPSRIVNFSPGRGLAALRAARGLSQRGLAARTGTSGAYISQLEHGRRRPSPDLLRRLLAVLSDGPRPHEEGRP